MNTIQTTQTDAEREARARLDAYCASPATKARFAEQAEWFKANMPAGIRDSSGNSVECLISNLERASR